MSPKYMHHLPSPFQEATEAYLKMQFLRPGRCRLFANGYEQYGPSLNSLGYCVNPLIFEDNSVIEEFYGVAGTCFLARYRHRLFAITAQHCLNSDNGDDVRIALNPKTRSFLPLKKLHRAVSKPPKQDFADIAVFEAAPDLLSTEEQESLDALVLDPLRLPAMEIKSDAKLVVPCFPKYLNSVDYDRFVIHTQRYLPSGNYKGSADRPHVHRMEFDSLGEIDWPDGMSGSPVFFVESHPEAHFFGFIGLVIKAQKTGKSAEFIGANVLYRMMDQIIDE